MARKYTRADAAQAWQLVKRERFLYNGFRLFESFTYDVAANATTLQAFTWDDLRDELLAVHDVAANATCLVAHDANRNVTELVSPAGEIKAHYEYGPFGQPLVQTGAYAARNPFRFSSEQYDADLALVYYNYRYYNPEIGRWASRDPIEEKGGFNLYMAMMNDSINKIDILGEELDWKPPTVSYDEDNSKWLGENKGRVGYFLGHTESKYTQTTCAGGMMLKEITLTVRGEIHIAKGTRDFKYKVPPYRTNAQHEWKHADFLRRAMSDFYAVATSYIGVCRCQPCFDATMAYIKVLFTYYHAISLKNSSDMDKNDYNGGDPEADTKLKSAEDALTKSCDALNAACGYLP